MYCPVSFLGVSILNCLVLCLARRFPVSFYFAFPCLVFFMSCCVLSYVMLCFLSRLVSSDLVLSILYLSLWKRRCQEGDGERR
jgi:hypothetical protein